MRKCGTTGPEEASTYFIWLLISLPVEELQNRGWMIVEERKKEAACEIRT